MMALACGTAGMRVRDFYGSTPREVQNVIHGFYQLERQRNEVHVEAMWAIARSQTSALMALVVGGDKVNWERLPYFPEYKRPGSNNDRPVDSKLDDTQIAALESKMFDVLKNPDKYQMEIHGRR